MFESRKNSWHKYPEERPKDAGPYWIYLPECLFQRGILFGHWDGYSFDFEEENDAITHFHEIKRPGRPKKQRGKDV